MDDSDFHLVFSADNAYNTILTSSSSPDSTPLYTIISDPGIDPGSTAFTSITKGQEGPELARWHWRARWRGDLLTYAGAKPVKATSWTAERDLEWKMSKNDGSERGGVLELFRGKDAAPLARFVQSAPAAAEPAKLCLLGSALVDPEFQDAIVVSFFLQERTRREKEWAAQLNEANRGPGRWGVPMFSYVGYVGMV
ncbi:hypothetical protein PENSPDRAFT_646471 [Peniophora sp. CONT]|nr:hypothetical protein PENSPDRAFT_646471 [Peniophora sp. CONT]